VRVVYFVHNLNDPAVAKRVTMLKAAGVDTFLVGFWRGTRLEIMGAEVFPLGESFDAKLTHRAFLSLKSALLPGRLVEAIGCADLLMARNLEMLVIAAAVSGKLSVPLVYEVLDIHRLLVPGHAAGVVLRWVERALMRRVALLLVSSPAFLTTYFERFQFGDQRPVTALIENKLLELGHAPVYPEETMLAPGPPWRIGWLGMLRCRKSLAMLLKLAARRPDLLQVEIYGRPTKEISEDLAKGLPPSVRFGGAYRPLDLARLYGGMHFSWAIDYFEEGLNSQWLLPNRIYEGGYYNVVPLALSGTETAHWLKGLGLGVLLHDPEKEVELFLERLTPEAYLRLIYVSAAAPREAFTAGQSECDRVGRLLRQAAGGRGNDAALVDQIAIR
jgi:succinoglycan biosynthesis protein ExoL